MKYQNILRYSPCFWQKKQIQSLQQMLRHQHIFLRKCRPATWSKSLGARKATFLGDFCGSQLLKTYQALTGIQIKKSDLTAQPPVSCCAMARLSAVQAIIWKFSHDMPIALPERRQKSRGYWQDCAAPFYATSQDQRIPQPPALFDAGRRACLA